MADQSQTWAAFSQT
jgi:splicing factor 3A subunit 3